DRTNIELPAVQRKCLQELKAAGKKVVFVNCSGSAIAFAPETASCDAILQAWYPGESGGQAVADVLFGDYNPAGKLPVSFYKNSDILGDFEDYSMKGRTYRYTTNVLFPFGFGLSYSKFQIGTANLSKTKIKSNENTQLNFSIKNISKREGTEIVQVYVRKVNDKDGPLKTLKAFKRINLKAGEKQDVTIDLPAASFEFYDESTRGINVTSGEYEVYYGTSSDGKDLKAAKLFVQ
ncbi:MAG: glycoside hydrolase family 3 C-terminal domain-containing protein, partial [Flavobacterium piscis]|nr:glycoside hydrolase family 3 C-terminal domain-containing protein [Flavobacterium piscis]